MAELTWWSFLAFGLLPLPLALIAILSSPAPRVVRKAVLSFVERVLRFEIRPPFVVLHVALLLTGASLAVSLSKAVAYQREVSDGRMKLEPNVLALMLAKKFRAERNVYISAFAFAAWAMLLVTHRVNKEKHLLRGRLLSLQGKAAEAAQEVELVGRQGGEGAGPGADRGAEAPAGEAAAALGKKEL